MLIVRTIQIPLAGLEVLAAEARAEGFRFIDRLMAEWENSEAQFSGPRELLLGALDDGGLVGVAGLIPDPYSADCRTARLRHLYVRPDWRRRRIGTALVAAIRNAAAAAFDRLRLRTDSAEAARFYRALGFTAIDGPDATHSLELR